MNLQTMSVTELKALKCDCFERMQQEQQNIAILNAELQKRQNEKPKEPEVKE